MNNKNFVRSFLLYYPMKIRAIVPIFAAIILSACGSQDNPHKDAKNPEAHSGATKVSMLHYPQEKHLSNVRMLTDGGDNAEAYFSFDDKAITFQASNPEWGDQCDQIYTSPLAGADMINNRPQLISTGKGRTTCAYFMPGNQSIIYASTHLADEDCPPVPEKRADGKYIWPIYKGFDIFTADLEGNILKQLTNEEGYDAEATVSPLGDKIVFTSTRSGDLELYTMNIDGSDVKQITNELGYDGGAFFSPDGQQLIFRSSRPKTAKEIKDYKDLLAKGLVTPTEMELYICNADGSDIRKLTNLGQANWAPFFHPSGKKIIFSSNHASEKGYPFNLYMIDTNGENLEQITWDGVFDAFPMFSFDGKKLIFGSNRSNSKPHDTNLFIADWID